MKNLKDLIQKVETFEKMAVYGDRSSFLKAIAQSNINPQTKSIIQEISSVLALAGITDESVLGPVNNALFFNNVDVSTIRQAVMNAAHRMTGMGEAETASRLLNLAQQLISNVSPVTTPMNEETVNTPAPNRIQGYPAVDKKEQQALSKILTIEGLGLPLEVDGKYGPETSGALQKFKKKFNLSSMSDAEALLFAKMLAETDKYRTADNSKYEITENDTI